QNFFGMSQNFFVMSQNFFGTFQNFFGMSQNFFGTSQKESVQKPWGCLINCDATQPIPIVLLKFTLLKTIANGCF
ncbi:MAG TPA: hypothetical protein VL093_03350, partial [Flavipsychrobacter sp.]|nr:hypothetical protein [Flavipsychrobacter sp.]